MSTMVPRSFIDDLLARTDIVNLINARIPLVKKGKNFSACCPFHNEKNPSFFVNSEKQFYYCFGCNSHGNAIDFLMHYYQFKFIESIKELASFNNISIPSCYNIGNSINQKKININNKLYLLMNSLNRFYLNTLNNNDKSSLANQYLKKRGINQETIKKFSVGFSPSKYQLSLNNLHKESEEFRLLIKIGFFIKKHYGKICSLFYKRITFPIRDKYGRVIAFGGRTLNDNKFKYINSPETEIFHKGHQLYGLYELECQKIYIPKLLVVEGYIDVLILVQSGINYTVSLLGTSATNEQIKLLYSITNNIIFCFDGDDAGKQAAWRTLKNALVYLTDNRQLSFMSLPDGEDPDTLLHKIGKVAFEKLIEQATQFSIFLFQKTLFKLDLSNIYDRVKLCSLLLPMINKVPGKLLRLFLRKKLSNTLGIIEDHQLEELFKKKTYHKNIVIQKKIKCTNMHLLIGLLVQNPSLSIIVPKYHGLEQIKFPSIILFVNLVKICQNNPGLTTGRLLEYYRGNKFHIQLERLAIWNHMITDDNIKIIFTSILFELYNFFLQEYQNKLITKDRVCGLTNIERRKIWLLSKILAKKYKF